MFDARFVFGAVLLAPFGSLPFGYDQGVTSIIGRHAPVSYTVFSDVATPLGKGLKVSILELGVLPAVYLYPL